MGGFVLKRDACLEASSIKVSPTRFTSGDYTNPSTRTRNQNNSTLPCSYQYLQKKRIPSRSKPPCGHGKIKGGEESTLEFVLTYRLLRWISRKLHLTIALALLSVWSLGLAVGGLARWHQLLLPKEVGQMCREHKA